MTIRLSPDETLSLYGAYIRRLARWVDQRKRGDTLADVMLGTVSPSELAEAEALSATLSRYVEQESESA